MDLISKEAIKKYISAPCIYVEGRRIFYEEDLDLMGSAFEGMTNGEVMKAIFPDIEVTINKFLGSVVIDGAFGKFVTTLDWWLDSYKGVSE